MPGIARLWITRRPLALCAIILAATLGCRGEFVSSAPLRTGYRLLSWPGLIPLGDTLRVSLFAQDTVQVELVGDDGQLVGARIEWSSSLSDAVDVRPVPVTEGPDSLASLRRAVVTARALTSADLVVSGEVVHPALASSGIRIPVRVAPLDTRDRQTTSGPSTPDPIRRAWPGTISVTQLDTVSIVLRNQAGVAVAPLTLRWRASDDGAVRVTALPAFAVGDTLHRAEVEGVRADTADLIVTITRTGFGEQEIRQSVAVVPLSGDNRWTERGPGTPDTLTAAWPRAISTSRRDTVSIVFRDSFGRAMAGLKAQWRSTDASVLRVTSVPVNTGGDTLHWGLIEGLRSGTATVVLTVLRSPLGTQEIQHGITVTPLRITRIGWPTRLTVTREAPLAATVTDLDGVPLRNPTVRWDSSDPDALLITPSPAPGDTVRAVATARAGRPSVVTMTVSEPGFEEVRDTATVAVADIVLQPWSASGGTSVPGWPSGLAVAETREIGLTIRDDAGLPLAPVELANLRVQWRSSHTGVLGVDLVDVNDERRVRLIGRSAGTATVTASVSKGGRVIAEREAGIPVQPLVLRPISWPDTASVGDTLTLRVAVVGSGQGVLDSLGAAWSSSNDNRATVRSSRYDATAREFEATVLIASRGPVALVVDAGRAGAIDRAATSDSVIVRERWRNVQAGVAHTCAVAWDFGAYCWGAGLGIGRSGATTTPEPVEFRPAERVLEFTAPLAGNVTDDGRGLAFSTCAIVVNGPPFCWGNNNMGKLGLRDQEDRFFPERVLISQAAPTFSVAISIWHTCAVSGNKGTPTTVTTCWGWSGTGVLGNGGAPFSPSQTCRREPDNETLGCALAPVVVMRQVNGPLLGLTKVSVGQSQSCGLRYDGGVYCWGRTDVSATGDSLPVTDDGICAPGPCTPFAKRVTGPNALVADIRFVDVAAGGVHTCALSDAGVVYCWGWNSSGQLGPSVAVNAMTTTPTPVPGLPPIAAITAGLLHVCAVARDSGTAYCWGSNGQGELGRGFQDALRTDPAPVTSPAGSALALGFAQLSAGISRTCGVTTGGELYCWGRNQVSLAGGGAGLLGRIDVTDVIVTRPVRAGDPVPNR